MKNNIMHFIMRRNISNFGQKLRECACFINVNYIVLPYLRAWFIRILLHNSAQPSNVSRHPHSKRPIGHCWLRYGGAGPEATGSNGLSRAEWLVIAAGRRVGRRRDLLGRMNEEGKMACSEDR
jgi:hypothetical protein